jgi:hypothetical protein
MPKHAHEVESVDEACLVGFSSELIPLGYKKGRLRRRLGDAAFASRPAANIAHTHHGTWAAARATSCESRLVGLAAVFII